MNRTCDNCAYLTKKEGDAICHINNPGMETKIEDTSEMRCPRWEKKNLKAISNSKRKKHAEDLIIYEIVR